MSLSGNTEKINELLSKINALPESEEPSYQAKTVSPSTSAQTVEPDSGYDALSQVTVNAIPSTYVKPSATKSATTYTPSTSNQTIAAGTYCSGAQTIKGDSNLVAGNIKKGTSIFGVAGSYEGSSSGGGGGGGGTFAMGSVTPAYSSYDFKITHNLGVLPNLYIVYCSNPASSDQAKCIKDIIIYCPDVNNGNTYVGGYNYSTNSGKSFQKGHINDYLITASQLTASSNYIKGATDTYFYIGKRSTNTSYFYYAVKGWTYNWIVGVI